MSEETQVSVEERVSAEAQVSMEKQDYMEKARELADSYPQLLAKRQELKQQIEDQLIVTKDENGSHVRWV